jgi:hypothetical protein
MYLLPLWNQGQYRECHTAECRGVSARLVMETLNGQGVITHAQFYEGRILVLLWV